MPTVAQRWGVEIEAYGLSRNTARDIVESVIDDVCLLREDNRASSIVNWAVVHDGSIKENGEFEIRTPVMYGETTAFQQIRDVCKALRENGAKVNHRCGLHVHHDVSYIDKAIRRLFTKHPPKYPVYRSALQLYAKMEPVLDSIMPPSRRGDTNCYCQTTIPSRHEATSLGLPETWEVHQDPIGGHHCKLSVAALEVHNTLEYRHHSGTLNASKITAWIKLTWLIHQKVAEISLGQIPVPVEDFASLGELLSYVDASEKLREYYFRRLAALKQTSCTCNKYWECTSRYCKARKAYIDTLLDILSYRWTVASRSGTWSAIVDREVFYRIFEHHDENQISLVVQNCMRNIAGSTLQEKMMAGRDALSRYLGITEVSFGPRSSDRPFNPNPSFSASLAVDESNFVISEDEDYSGGKQPDFLALTKKGWSLPDREDIGVLY